VSFRRQRMEVRVWIPTCIDPSSEQCLSYYRRNLTMVQAQEGICDGARHCRFFVGGDLLAFHPPGPLPIRWVSVGNADHGVHMPGVPHASMYSCYSASTTKAGPSYQKRPSRRIQGSEIFPPGGGHVLRVLGHVPPILLSSDIRDKSPHDHRHGQQPRRNIERRLLADKFGRYVPSYL